QHPRKVLGLTLDDVIERWRMLHDDTQPPVASKINRWESGSKPRDYSDFVLRLRKIYEDCAIHKQIDITLQLAEMQSTFEQGDPDGELPIETLHAGTAKKLRLGLTFSPDSAVLAAILKTLPNVDLDEQPMGNSYREIPALVDSGQ